MTAKKPIILCTWELENELGHLSRLSTIAHDLQYDYEMNFALRDLSRPHPFTESCIVGVFQAPVLLPKMRLQRPNLLSTGYTFQPQQESHLSGRCHCIVACPPPRRNNLNVMKMITYRLSAN